MIISVLVVLVAVTITIIALLSITVLYFKRKMKKMTNSEDSMYTVNNSHQQSHSQEIELTRNVTYSHGMELKDNIAYQQCPGSNLNDNAGYENTQIPGSNLNDNAGYEDIQIEPRASTLQSKSVVDDNGGYEVIN